MSKLGGGQRVTNRFQARSGAEAARKQGAAGGERRAAQLQLSSGSRCPACSASVMPSCCSPRAGQSDASPVIQTSKCQTACGFGNVCPRLVAIPEVLSVHKSR
jgi:hypothetical protein